MGYRNLPLPDKRVHIVETAVESVIHVDNGSITHIAIPCFYKGGVVLTRLDMMMIDHAGWPSPGHRDRSAQVIPPYGFTEIDLPREGYNAVEVVFLDPPSGLAATGDIDVGVVNVTISSMCQSAESNDVEVPFSIYITGTSGSESLRSVVTKGTLHIVAGPIS